MQRPRSATARAARSSFVPVERLLSAQHRTRTGADVPDERSDTARLRVRHLAVVQRFLGNDIEVIDDMRWRRNVKRHDIVQRLGIR